jgi:hypothetical protein
MESKAKIEFLLKKQKQSDKLERYLDLYGKIDDFVEKKSTIMDKLRVAFNPVNLPKYHEINYSRTDIPGCNLKIKALCGEVLHALREHYERKILELAEGEQD